MAEPARPTPSPARAGWRRFRSHAAGRMGLFVLVAFAVLGVAAPLASRFVTHFDPMELHGELALSPPGTRDVPLVHPTYDGDPRVFDRLDTDGDGLLVCQRVPSAGEGVPLLPVLRRDWPVIHDAILREVEAVERDGVPLRELLRLRTGRLACPELDRPRALWERLYRDLFTTYDTDGGRPDGVLVVTEFPRDDAALADPTLAGQGLAGPAAFARLDLDGDGRLRPDELRDATRHTRFDPVLLLRDHDHDRNLRLTRAELPGAPELHPFRFGTDAMGRDILTRLLHGARVSLLVAVLATLVALTIGVVYGATAGTAGRLGDELLMRFVDVLFGLPFPFLVILALTVAGQSLLHLALLLGLVQWMTLARIVRAQVRGLRGAPFVEAARVYGARRRTIVGHLLRNAAGPIVAYAMLLVPGVIVEEAFLSFLGLGVPAGTPSWGALVAEGAQHVVDYPWLIVAPAAALGATLYAFHFVGDGLRRALDPR